VRRDNEWSAYALGKVLKLFLFCLFLHDEETNRDEGDEEEQKPVSSIENENSVSESLFEIIEGMRAEIKLKSQSAWGKFETKLMRAGYTKKYENNYKWTPRKAIRLSFYEVTNQINGERFPRIIRSDLLGTGKQLPLAIRKVKYLLRLGDIETFQTEPDFVVRQFSELHELPKITSKSERSKNPKRQASFSLGRRKN
jgi:hypothetical protein